MPFSDTVKEEALVKSRRSCCVCSEFTGLYTNVHHIIQEADGGPNTIDNAIVLCLRCHGEAGHYNPKHPIGDKYKPSELVKLRDQWWQWCRDNPGRPLLKHSITISPSVIALAADSSWRTKATFDVHNTKQQLFYEVWVKIGIASQKAKLSHIAVTILKGGTGLKLQAGHVEVNTVVTQIAGLDQTGNQAILLDIRSLAPNELYTFQIEQLAAFKLPTASPHRLDLGIIGFSETPPVAAEGSNEAYFTFTLPEPFTLVQTRMLMRRTR
jgi:hypothetical protein